MVRKSESAKLSDDREIGDLMIKCTLDAVAARKACQDCKRIVPRHVPTE